MDKLIKKFYILQILNQIPKPSNMNQDYNKILDEMASKLEQEGFEIVEVEKNKLELSPSLSFLNNDGLDIRIKYKLKKDNYFIDCPKVFLELDYYALINLLKN
jgi:hypothetical protein